MRLLFSSIHCYLDPSSGAALCTRESLELLAGRWMDYRVLATGFLKGDSHQIGDGFPRAQPRRGPESAFH
jgi:hypothetical protein